MKTNKGKFQRKHLLWTLENWDDGYYDNRGRFRVYRPDYPRSYKEGYCLRAHVVWWLAKGRVHPKGTVLHHINEIKDDDRFENLEVMEHGKHTAFHSKKEKIQRECVNCGKSFEVTQWRINQRSKEGNQIKFCSQACFQSYPKVSKKVSRICEWCGKSFLVIPCKITRRFCSNSCSVKHTWSKK